MTRPQWRVLHEGEEPPAGRSARDLGDGRRAWFDDLNRMDDDDDDYADDAADADAGVATPPGNSEALDHAEAGYDPAALREAAAGLADTDHIAASDLAAAALREVAARLARLPKVERELQQKVERGRLGVSFAAMKAAIAEALETEAAAAERESQQADSEQAQDPDFSTADEPEETLDDAVQRLVAMDGLDYAMALREAARRFKIPATALEQAVQRNREPASAQPAAASIVLPRRFTLDETGLWYQPLPSARNPDPRPVFVCGPFQVLGEARDLESRAWGVAITWLDHDRRPHVWSCPQRLVHLDGNAIAAELADAGLTCATSKEGHELLKQFFGSLRTSHRLQSAERAGWHATSTNAGIVAHDAVVITPQERP